MKTESRVREDAGRMAGAGCIVETHALSDADKPEGVIAVVVERDDGTCALLREGSSASWPSIDEAKSAVDSTSVQVAWRETTPGVWTARADGSAPPALDRSYGRSRRAEPARPTRAPARGDSYMAASVFRGTARSGHTGGIPPRVRADASV